MLCSSSSSLRLRYLLPLLLLVTASPVEGSGSETGNLNETPGKRPAACTRQFSYPLARHHRDASPLSS
jgi:hypothetical protein